MPNWCIGDLKVRGKYKDIREFLSNELIVVGENVPYSENRKPTIVENEFDLTIETEDGDFWLKNATRSYFNDHCIIIYCDEKEKEDVLITTNLGELHSAWDLDAETLTQLSKQYNLDFKIYAYERGMEFNVDFEVHKGEIITNEEIKFDDYVWECSNPEIGG